MLMKRLYLAGPMTGLPEFNYPPSTPRSNVSGPWDSRSRIQQRTRFRPMRRGTFACAPLCARCSHVTQWPPCPTGWTHPAHSLRCTWQAASASKPSPPQPTSETRCNHDQASDRQPRPRLQPDCLRRIAQKLYSARGFAAGARHSTSWLITPLNNTNQRQCSCRMPWQSLSPATCFPGTLQPSRCTGRPRPI